MHLGWQHLCSGNHDGLSESMAGVSLGEQRALCQLLLISSSLTVTLGSFSK